ncbi:MAG: hypothetical protein JWO88_3997 [Frankiales bacterium]|nr:hypothetical protein [Frankiales bacterium]
MGYGSQRGRLNHVQSLMTGDHTQSRNVMLRAAESLDRQSACSAAEKRRTDA